MYVNLSVCDGGDIMIVIVIVGIVFVMFMSVYMSGKFCVFCIIGCMCLMSVDVGVMMYL